jgi:seryl-tRNA synthetase
MIDYGRLDRSVKFYEKEGYQRIESPWTVTKAVSSITKPPGGKDWEIIGKDKVLVASGEQSFLYLYLKGFLPKGKYQTITPCFREEPFDHTHTKYFMKNELIITDNVNEQSLKSIIYSAKEFFENELECDVQVVETIQGYDLEVNGIEIGSYGIRSCDYLEWVYGTGLAEPRFSAIKNMIR